MTQPQIDPLIRALNVLYAGACKVYTSRKTVLEVDDFLKEIDKREDDEWFSKRTFLQELKFVFYQGSIEMTWGSATGGIKITIDASNHMDTIDFTRLVDEKEVKGGSHLMHTQRWMLVPMVMKFILGADPHEVLSERPPWIGRAD